MSDINILGISAFYHDSAACLVRNGEIISAAQEERFTRKKHDDSYPENAIEYCLKAGGISKEQITHVAFYEKPWLTFERLLETYIAFAPKGLPSFLKAMPVWITEKLWIGDTIKKNLEFKGEVYFPEHHQSHAASAFYPSPFTSSAFLTVDGVGEWATTSWGVGKDNKLTTQFELKFPHSLGLLYSAVTYYTGFKVNSGEYKVMGLAPYGEPKYVDTILENLIDLKADGSFRLNMDYFNYCSGLTMTNKKFDELFGAPPRTPESQLGQREMDLARSFQEVTEEVMLRMARHIRKVTGEKNLCLAGGVALNCVANGKIYKEGIFENIFIQPAAGDAGGALGVAQFVWHQVLGNERKVGKRDSLKASLLGPEFSETEIEEFLREKGIFFEKYSKEEISKITAKKIADGKVIGWFSGRMEFGPRALGARSILGDPRSSEMQKILNLKIKFRESFRPFAPSCLAEDVSEYFEIEGESPYMLLVVDVQQERRRTMNSSEQGLFGIDKLNIKRSDLPAITHVDYSARVQTVTEEDNPVYYDLINEFKKLTGYGVVINTSFNVRGEPIVCTPEDAYRCFMKTNMDSLVLGNYLISKENRI